MSEISSPNVTFESLNSMKVVDLRQELDKRGLDKSGLKADLVKRLERSMLDESSMTDINFEDNEEGKIEPETSQVSEFEDAQMESADNNDLIKGEDVDEAFSEQQLLDTNKFSEEENGFQEKEVKEKLTSILDTIEATGGLFHRVDDIELVVEEEKRLFITAEFKEVKNIEGNSDKITINLNTEKGPKLMNVPDTISDELDDNNSVEKIAIDELKTMEQNNHYEFLDLSVNEENHSDKEIFLNKEKLEKATDGVDDKSLTGDDYSSPTSDEPPTSDDKSPTGDDSDKIQSKSSDQVSKQNSNTEIVNTSSKEPSEISDSSENKKDSLFKSDNTVKRNEDKKTDLSKCIWISGLSSVTKAVDLKDICSKVGKVLGAKVVTSAKTPGSQCFGFVTMSSSDEAKKCIEVLHKSTLHEKIIQVEKAKTDPTPPKNQTEKKSEKQEDRSQSSRQSKSSRTSSTSRASRRDDRGSRRDERRSRETQKEKESKKEVITIEDNDKNAVAISTPKNLSPVSKRPATDPSKNQEKTKNDTDTETKTSVEDSDKKDAKSVEQLRKERAEKIEHEHKLREERRRKERERERQLREEQRKEQDKREKERRERARKEAERVRKEREKQRELEKQREKERERERERFLLERKEREERERRDRERERELLERERLEREKLERERKERERLELERIERERQEQERLEKERLARIERDSRIEKERQRLEQERLDRERRDRDRSRIIDRGIDRNIGNGSGLKRSAYDDRVLYYTDSKRSLREDSPLSNRKDFFSSSENPDSYLKDDDYDLLNQRRSLLPPGNNRSKSDHRNERRNNEDRRDLRNDRQPREEDLYRDRPVFNVQPDVRRVVQRADSRPFNRDRSPIRVDERNTLRDLDRRDWLEVQSNAPKTLSDVLGRAGLTGILGNQAEIKSFDIRPLNQQIEEEQYYIRSSNRVDDRAYRSDVRDVREDARAMHGLERLHKERVELSDSRIENKGLQRYDERRSDARKDLERRDIRNSPPLRTRNEERVFRNSDPPHMLNNHELKGALQDSITDRRGLHPAAADLGNRGLPVVPPRILPIPELFGRPMQQVPAGSTAAQALQAGYVAAAHGLALHQAAQNIQLRDGRLEYTQQVRQPVPNLRRY